MACKSHRQNYWWRQGNKYNTELQCVFVALNATLKRKAY